MYYCGKPVMRTPLPLHLVTDVEANKQGGQTLDHPGIKGQTSINRMQAHLLHQTA